MWWEADFRGFGLAVYENKATGPNVTLVTDVTYKSQL